ncbi:hypothetical protein GJ496_003514 [Pomphorhynchus laevis]|nr:hypothetical protein GJ496_003514 [Pomphorhynchus laevis]
MSQYISLSIRSFNGDMAMLEYFICLTLKTTSMIKRILPPKWLLNSNFLYFTAKITIIVLRKRFKVIPDKEHPYASRSEICSLSQMTSLTPKQIKKWLSKKAPSESSIPYLRLHDAT